MRLSQLRNVVFVVAATTLGACKEITVPNYNNPNLEQLTNNPTANTVNTAIVGIVISLRDRVGTEASAMGGGVWQDNTDGTYTQLDDDYYVPATGWSYLDLYLMGLAAPAEVPDFFILRNLVPAGRDANGHPIFPVVRAGRRSPALDRMSRN